ncbi:MAG: hypothetical protein HY521_00785 [Proteobacteria bacterium]|nr:hypothetical protein [Pseudomonadota bacterium]
MRPEDYRKREEAVGEWRLGIITYRLGEEYVCEVDNVSPGARLARAKGRTREAAETQALGKARHLLSKTRVRPVG